MAGDERDLRHISGSLRVIGVIAARSIRLLKSALLEDVILFGVLIVCTKRGSFFLSVW